MRPRQTSDVCMHDYRLYQSLSTWKVNTRSLCDNKKAIARLPWIKLSVRLGQHGQTQPYPNHWQSYGTSYQIRAVITP
jgi:hypothetical protein